MHGIFWINPPQPGCELLVTTRIFYILSREFLTNLSFATTNAGHEKIRVDFYEVNIPSVPWILMGMGSGVQVM